MRKFIATIVRVLTRHVPHASARRLVCSMLVVTFAPFGWVFPGWPLTFAGEAGLANTQPMLSPQDAAAAFQLPPGFEIRLVAAEPDLVNPISMAVDERGRIYVSQSHTYRYGPEQSPVDPPANPVIRFELDREGRIAKRAVVASGFENPVMGLAVHESRLWVTNLNEVIVADINEQGRATGQRTIVRDAASPWNPFGMYRIEWGHDGWLTLSVGDHPISLTGSSNSMAVRGNTGGLFRFRPDGSEIELLGQGFRAPFSFDCDPYGRRWLLSNGEGNPNRLIELISGADYHFQTRPVGWDWLAGNEPLAPPVWENPAGAHTAVLVYRSDAFPAEYWGNLFVSNWGVHGFPSANHVIVRHVLDSHGNRLRSEPFLTTTDPHFRPTQICHAPDGNLYVLDWYGRDDENDLTGRLYRIVYVGTGQAATRAAAAGLASRNSFSREEARRKWLAAGPAAADRLKQWVTGSDPLAAAEALWTLQQCDWPAVGPLMELGLRHADWRVRRLAVQLLAERGVCLGRLPSGQSLQSGLPTRQVEAEQEPQSATDQNGPDDQAQQSKLDHAMARLLNDTEPAVAMEAAMALLVPAERLTALTAVLRRGAAENRRLRYRAALEVARHGAPGDFETLLVDSDGKVRLAGLIALDEAFHEGNRAALGVLIQRLAEPGKISLLELLAIGERWPDKGLVTPVVRQLQGDVSVAQFARGLAILRRLGVPATPAVLSEAIERLLRQVGGELSTATQADKVAVLRIARIDVSAPSTYSIVASLVRDAGVEVREAAHRVLVAGAVHEAAFITLCWELARDETLATESRIDAIASLVQIESRCRRAWLDLLDARSPQLAMAALRCLQKFAGQDEAVKLLEIANAKLMTRGEPLVGELHYVQRVFDSPSSTADAAVSTKVSEDKRAVLRGWLLAHAAEGDPLLGRLAFRRGACSRCHLADSDDTLLGPRLNGVAKTNGLEYLVDSVLYPSRVIKTGFMVEVVLTDDGKSLVGKVIEQGDRLTIITADGERHPVAKDHVEERQQIQQSLMPEALEASMSQRELLDLIAYLREQ